MSIVDSPSGGDIVSTPRAIIVPPDLNRMVPTVFQEGKKDAVDNCRALAAMVITASPQYPIALGRQMAATFIKVRAPDGLINAFALSCFDSWWGIGTIHGLSLLVTFGACGNWVHELEYLNKPLTNIFAGAVTLLKLPNILTHWVRQKPLVIKPPSHRLGAGAAWFFATLFQLKR